MILIVCKDPSHKDGNDCKINQKIQPVVKEKTLSYDNNTSGSFTVYDCPSDEQNSKKRDKK